MRSNPRKRRRLARPTPLTEETRLAYRLNEAAQMLGISDTSIWRLVRDGAIKVTTVGTIKLITRDELQRLGLL